ncbi:MAG: beta-ketoacyl-[acyl-carrier-protein] synthase family protein [Bacteroidales bacterium]|nr:beta-ketoacyl-[acyl-carrier-protein] synthase family protein [Bacteroidales bacterium]
MKEGISVTGMGIICAIGNDCAQVLDSLKQGRSGIRKMKYLESVHRDIPVGEVMMSNARMHSLLGIPEGETVSRTSMMGAIAIREALSRAGDISGKRVALISGTTVGDLDITEKYFQRMKTDDSLLNLPHSNECGTSTMEMARLTGLSNAQVCTISTACSSALNAIILGCEMLRSGEADVVVAGGSESLSRFHLNGFNTLMILDRAQCRPFDASHAGLNLGEGAAFVVLTKDARNPLCYIGGYGNRCDAYHQTASSDDGEGAFLAMSEALSLSGLKASDIQYVNAHGTGTPNNDYSESQALRRVFGENIPEVSSTKAFTGHTTSASGSIETVMCILAMLHDFTPANLGWKSPVEGGIVPTSGHIGVKLDNVMCNSFGFGGNDSSLVLCREPRPLPELVKARNCTVAACVTVTSAEELSGLREFISPMESRRMGKLMKAALLASLKALQSAGLQTPDAIISATSRGMLELSQQFMDNIDEGGEELLSPTLFMQSTHNTLGSAVAIRTRCHGYNTTYSQGEESELWALRDAERLIRSSRADSVLVGIFDESTPAFDSFSQRTGTKVPAPLYAKAMILTAEK